MSQSDQYTAWGRRINAMCGPHPRIAAALGLNKSQVSRKLRGEISMTVEELLTISARFDIPVWMFFTQDDIDDAVFAECYRMFRQDALALDRIIDAFNADPKNLRKLGEIAVEMRRASEKEKRKHDSSGG